MTWTELLAVWLSAVAAAARAMANPTASFIDLTRREDMTATSIRCAGAPRRSRPIDVVILFGERRAPCNLAVLAKHASAAIMLFSSKLSPTCDNVKLPERWLKMRLSHQKPGFESP